MDPFVQYPACRRVHLYQSPETGDTQQDAYARPAKPLVRSARHRLYVCLRHVRRGRHLRPYLLFHRKGQSVDTDRMALCDNLVYVGTAFLAIGMLFGAIWAKEAWGALLELGPERNLGRRHLVGEPPVYPL